MARTRKVKSTGRFGAGYGLRIRTRLKKVEGLQRKRQICPFCKKQTIKKMATGIWSCKSCKKRFASDAYTAKE